MLLKVHALFTCHCLFVFVCVDMVVLLVLFWLFSSVLLHFMKIPEEIWPVKQDALFNLLKFRKAPNRNTDEK